MKCTKAAIATFYLDDWLLLARSDIETGKVPAYTDYLVSVGIREKSSKMESDLSLVSSAHLQPACHPRLKDSGPLTHFVIEKQVTQRLRLGLLDPMPSTLIVVRLDMV